MKYIRLTSKGSVVKMTQTGISVSPFIVYPAIFASVFATALFFTRLVPRVMFLLCKGVKALAHTPPGEFVIAAAKVAIVIAADLLVESFKILKTCGGVIVVIICVGLSLFVVGYIILGIIGILKFGISNL